jgi:hypothetical protein
MYIMKAKVLVYGKVVLEEVPVYGAGRLALVRFDGANVGMGEWRSVLAKAMANAKKLTQAGSLDGALRLLA